MIRKYVIFSPSSGHVAYNKKIRTPKLEYKVKVDSVVKLSLICCDVDGGSVISYSLEGCITVTIKTHR